MYVEAEYPIEIDVRKKYDKKTIVLQDVADIIYVPFENRENIILESVMRKLSVSDSIIVTYDRTGTIFVIDRDGNLISKFNRRGRGYGEYISINNYTVDFEKKEIYIQEQQLQYRILVYSMEGEFKRQIDISPPFWLRDIVNYDKDNLLIYVVLPPNLMKNRKDPFPPYYLVQKQSGELKPLAIYVTETKSGAIISSREIGKNQTMGHIRGYGTSPIIRNGEEFFISDFGNDTIYSLKGGKLSPFIVNKPSLQSPKQTVFVGMSLKTTRYSFLSVIKVDEISSDLTRKFLGIDHKTGEIFEVIFWNNDFEPEGSGEFTLENYYRNLPAEYTAYPISALRLTDNRDAGKLTGRLTRIASKMKEDDNPVLMLIKFK
jgi:hypothetical protein